MDLENSRLSFTVKVSFDDKPLYARVPTRDISGKPVNDFIMLIPGFRSWPAETARRTVNKIQLSLGHYREVMFAELNVPLNLLWVSVKARPGLGTEIAGKLLEQVPEARLIASPFDRLS